LKIIVQNIDNESAELVQMVSSGPILIISPPDRIVQHIPITNDNPAAAPPGY
jgi:hypothetical protein